MQKTILMKVSTKHLADVRKLLEFQRGRKHSIDFLSVEFVLQYPKETITFSATNGQNYGTMNT